MIESILLLLQKITSATGRFLMNRIRKPVTTMAFFLFAAFVYWGVGKFYHAAFEWYTGVKNAPLTYGAFKTESGETIENSRRLTDREFRQTAIEIVLRERKEAVHDKISEDNKFAKEVKLAMHQDLRSFTDESRYKHIGYFEEAGIRQYEGPATCLSCHKNMEVTDGKGHTHKVNTLDNVVNSVHFRFFSKEEGFSTIGYDGRKVNGKGTRKIPIGKIDRACGVPGSFSWTGWAALIETKPEHLHGKKELRSEGCGQCHIGGNFHPATEMMMPIGSVPKVAKEGIDCLICHSQEYNMNYRFVLQDKHGLRWNQDRTMKAAMAVTHPTNENCLNCHQHNLGGDAHEDNLAAKSLGFMNKRLLHIGSKRANVFSKSHDVHYAAGMKCTDCHVPEGHKIPRGTMGTDLVANDLPGKEVSCEKCHTSAPHVKSKDRIMLNGHTERVACETCHITKLDKRNAVLRDWIHPTWDEEEGLWTPTDIYRNGEPSHGIQFLWYNGKGTFLANALGANPNGSDDYNPLTKQLTQINDPKARAQIREEALGIIRKYNLDEEKYLSEAFDVLSQLTPEVRKQRAAEIEKNIRAAMESGKSKIYPFKVFNALMYEDMNNVGPYGGMILPFDYNTYYQTGNSLESARVATDNTMMRRMYQLPFKLYMMDEFMYYFGVPGWKTEYPFDRKGNPKNVQPKWMRQMGTLMINHGIEKGGRGCAECHSQNGILDYEKLGYSKVRIADLTNLRELKMAR